MILNEMDWRSKAMELLWLQIWHAELYNTHHEKLFTPAKQQRLDQIVQEAVEKITAIINTGKLNPNFQDLNFEVRLADVTIPEYFKKGVGSFLKQISVEKLK